MTPTSQACADVLIVVLTAAVALGMAMLMGLCAAAFVRHVRRRG